MNTRTTRTIHCCAWIIFLIISFLTQPGRIAADTKLDLFISPVHFLVGAFSAWSAEFPMGQLQNQPAGYLIPQGAFFVLFGFLPAWVAQRLWWTLILGLAFSGMYRLVTTTGTSSRTPALTIIAAIAWTAQPRIITTLGAISSEAWPVVLVPWILTPLLTTHTPTKKGLAQSLVAVGFLGAVNATATLWALVPAVIVWCWRIAAKKNIFQQALTWCIVAAGLCVWWLVPLLVLGHFAPPFTDYIETASITTRWLNPAEILRGTTSWVPFADTSRPAATQLATNPVFVLLSTAVAGLGVVGLTRSNHRLRNLWIMLLLFGFGIFGMAHGPLGEEIIQFLDGPGVALRNLHKADFLVRLPLTVGIALLGEKTLAWPHIDTPVDHITKRQAAGLLVAGLVLSAAAPIWSLRLAPAGTFTHIPESWTSAAQKLNTQAQHTRTLVWPSSRFALQDWGTTRDEPLQPLARVPWAVRDAIPLVPPGTIRGLDGLDAVLTGVTTDALTPDQAAQAAAELGIGFLAVRSDLFDEEKNDTANALTDTFRRAGYTITGDEDSTVHLIALDPTRHATVTDRAEQVIVAGGEEILPLLRAVTTAHQFVIDPNQPPRIVTDTPARVARNFGGEITAVSDPVDGEESLDYLQRKVADYPSAGTLLTVTTSGSHVTVSSSADHPTLFGGPQHGTSKTAAVDGLSHTAWYPAPTDHPNPSLTITLPEEESTDTVTIQGAGCSTDALFNGHKEHLFRAQPQTITLPAPAHTITVELLPTGTCHPGIAQISIPDHPIKRWLTIPHVPASTNTLLFQRLTIPNTVIRRQFTLDRTMTVHVTMPSPGAEVILDGQTVAGDAGTTLHLQKGSHQLVTEAPWILLHEQTTAPATEQKIDLSLPVTPATTDRVIATGHSFNKGFTAAVGGTTLVPTVVGAGLQGWIIPAGITGHFTETFTGQLPYRAGLVAGLFLWLVIMGGLLVLLFIRRNDKQEKQPTVTSAPTVLAVTVAGSAWFFICFGGPGLICWLSTVAAVRLARIPAWVLAAAGSALSGLWLAHAPWPAATYAGDIVFVGWAGLVAIAAAGAFTTTQNPPGRLLHEDKHPSGHDNG